jgi:TRAP-type C4-dicarboxylate transport system permease small subunit
MNRTLAGFLGFIGGLIAGYCIILFGWVAYTTIADVSDMGGGKTMGIAFFFAPVGGVIAGIICAALLVRIAGKPKGASA